jgi:hypothetical protein
MSDTKLDSFCMGCARGEKLDAKPVYFHISEVDGLPSVPCRSMESATAPDEVQRKADYFDALCASVRQGPRLLTWDEASHMYAVQEAAPDEALDPTEALRQVRAECRPKLHPMEPSEVSASDEVQRPHDTRLANAREQWQRCQGRLAEVERVLTDMTGESQGIFDNLALIRERLNATPQPAPAADAEVSDGPTAEQIAANWRDYGHTASMIVAEVCNRHKNSDLLATDAAILRRFNAEFDAYRIRAAMRAESEADRDA